MKAARPSPGAAAGTPTYNAGQQDVLRLEIAVYDVQLGLRYSRVRVRMGAQNESRVTSSGVVI